jgi:dolichol-phosphate mannosyltransferase/undecaprenyl-phosphate 4-deoxy-4-formamido-L-arabinose transferase
MKNAEIKFSIVCCCYNSSGSIEALVKEFQCVFQEMKAEYEILLVNDGSPNPLTWKTVSELAQIPDYNVTGINLFQNVGQQSATVCGLSYSKGEYVVTIDDDMQHKPSDLFQLYNKANHDVVIANLRNRKTGWANQLTSFIKSQFDRIVFSKPKNIRLSGYRLIKRNVVLEMLKVNTPSPFVPALMFYVTKDVVNVNVEHEPRLDGTSNYTFTTRLKLFSLIIINNSSVVLKLIGYIGVFALIGSISLLLYFFIAKLFFTSPPNGWTSLFSAILFFGGLTLFAVGLIGEYIIRMIPIVENKKAFIVREVVGNEPEINT